MLDRLASGGIFPVIMVTLLAFGYARVFDAKRPVYFGIGIAFVAVILDSQLLPAHATFRVAIAGNLLSIGTVLVWALPFLAYGSVIILVCSLATIVPVRRALRVQPTEALRVE